MMSKFRIVRVDVSSRKVSRISDYVAEEKPLHVFLNKTHYATIFCSPSNLKELAIGHLLSQGIIKKLAEIEKVDLKEEQTACMVKLKRDVDVERMLRLSRNLSRVILSACGSRSPYQFAERVPKVKADLKVKGEVIQESVSRLNLNAEAFRKTGGVHAAAIYDDAANTIAFTEDVGRHNAVDKVIGMATLKGTDLSRCFLALSGRMSGDIILKVARIGLPIVASLAAPLDSGIAVAKKAGVTLVGFVRGKRMNIYTFPKRISI